MKFQGSLVNEQGVTFAIVIVKMSVLSSKTESDRIAGLFSPIFPGKPIILMAQDSRGTPTYYGRPDIVKFLANVHISQIPWQEYTI